jgi:hypothetical protein
LDESGRAGGRRLPVAGRRRWGGGTTYGYGITSIFKPAGGSYPSGVVAELRAQNLGKCGTRVAYTRLFVREPTRPDGPPGAWFAWSALKTCRTSVE